MHIHLNTIKTEEAEETMLKHTCFNCVCDLTINSIVFV